MGFRINTNVPSLAAQRSLGKSVNEQNQTFMRLSSGSRIVKAGDDAAGLAISEQLRSEIRGTKQAERNANDGISLIQTAEGGLNELSNILIRLRELSVQAASDTIGNQERKFSDLEFQSLVQEVDRISSSTKYNGRALLNGEGGSVDIQVGTSNNPELDRIKYEAQENQATASHLEIKGLNIAEKEGAQENLDKIDKALNMVNGNRATLGALQNRISSTINTLQIKSENLSAANSRIRDADVAEESAKLIKSNILTSAGTSVLSQANMSAMQAVKLLG